MFNHSPKKITSLHHPLVKHFVKLRENRHYREEFHTTLVVGKTLVKEISETSKPIHVLALENEIIQDKSISHIVTEDILKKITGLSTSEELVAEFPLPQPTSIDHLHFVLILDQIQDPGNLGTLLRTALAFGWEGVLLLPGCVDPFNDKVIRASRGACFRLPYSFGTWESVVSIKAKRNQLPMLIADLEGIPLKKLDSLTEAFLILSNESQGASKEGLKVGTKVTIPMCGDMESLNVGVAGSILMYELKNE